MIKPIVLEFDAQCGIYIAKNVGVDRNFFISLKKKNYIQHAVSFQDLPEILLVEVHIVDEDLARKDTLEVLIYTDFLVPETWNTDAQIKDNKDLIRDERVGCMFDLDLVNVKIIEPGVSIMIEIPL